MNVPKIDIATHHAALTAQIEPLDGSIIAAQDYADMITHSKWWKQNVPHSWMSTSMTLPPNKVWITKVMPEEEPRAAAVFYYQMFYYQKKMRPKIGIVRTLVRPNTWAAEDKWTILHELAHLSVVNTTYRHGKKHTDAMLALVEQYLGKSEAMLLRKELAK